MSRRLISLNPDLKRLQDEGYDVEVAPSGAGFLLVKDVPYVNGNREVKRGILVSELTMAGERALMGTHVAMLAGEYPCDLTGKALDNIRHRSERKELFPGFFIDHWFSSKPVNGGKYDDYYHKMTTYAAILQGPALAIRPDVSAQTYPVISTTEEDGVFRYLDTATSRAGIGLANAKLALRRVAIVGLGGTGAYVLDLVAKTPVREIHLFDGDPFLSHNAFRAPGAASIEGLQSRPTKVGYLAQVYGNMRHGVVPHPEYLGADNVAALQSMDFVFLCMDAGREKPLIVSRLEEWQIRFIDVGIGVKLVDSSLLGIVRTTTSTPEHRESMHSHAPLGGAVGDPEYQENIQIADLNALNAALAVIKWKKLYGFYQDLVQDHNTLYSINDNILISGDQRG